MGNFPLSPPHMILLPHNITMTQQHSSSSHHNQASSKRNHHHQHHHHNNQDHDINANTTVTNPSTSTTEANSMTSESQLVAAAASSEHLSQSADVAASSSPPHHHHHHHQHPNHPIESPVVQDTTIHVPQQDAFKITDPSVLSIRDNAESHVADWQEERQQQQQQQGQGQGDQQQHPETIQPLQSGQASGSTTAAVLNKDHHQQETAASTPAAPTSHHKSDLSRIKSRFKRKMHKFSLMTHRRHRGNPSTSNNNHNNGITISEPQPLPPSPLPNVKNLPPPHNSDEAFTTETSSPSSQQSTSPPRDDSSCSSSPSRSRSSSRYSPRRRRSDAKKQHLKQKRRRILILYTGGTIGMQELPNGSYAPKAGFLVENLMGMYQFQAPNKPVRTMPVTKSGIEPTYDIIEYYPLLDSVNMTYSEWNKIAKDIQRFYDDYDAFVILHGTDTMAYTASALSFLLQNLAKTVVLTGSQIPLSQTRSDATDNLVGAMTIAIELNIPEVCIFFNGKLMRGNRCTKSNATGLNAFSSPKHPILAKLAIDLDVKWSVVRPQPADPLIVHQMKGTDVGVACLQLFPGMTDHLLRKFLEPPLTGLVLLTYGAGNAPDTRKEFVEALKEATDRGVVIVNCTQCQKGSVSQDTYAVGVTLTKAGVISGGDMTPEAALTKLLFLQSLGTSPTAVKKRIQVDMRGERTVRSTLDFQRQQSNFLSLIARTLREHPSSTDFDLFKSFLSPVVLCSFASRGDYQEMQALLGTNAVDVNSCDYDSRRPLHLASARGHKDVVTLLLKNGADPNLPDRFGRTSLDEALHAKHHEVAEILKSYGAKEQVTQKKIDFCQVQEDNVALEAQ